MTLELSQEKKTQIAACHGKGMTVKEIAKAAKLTEAQVDVFLQSIGKKPLYRSTQNRDVTRRYRRVTEEQKEQMQKMLDEGKTVYTIAKELDIDIKTVKKYTNSKEKSPQRLQPSQTQRLNMKKKMLAQILFLIIPRTRRKVKLCSKGFKGSSLTSMKDSTSRTSTPGTWESCMDR